MDKEKIDILRFQYRYKDPFFMNKLKFLKHFFLVIILVIAFYVFQPFSILKEKYQYKLENPKPMKQYMKIMQDFEQSTMKYIWPTNGQITSGYGERIDPITGNYMHHSGIDISCYSHGDNILSVADGIVIFSGSQEGYGNCIEIEHHFENETIYTFYAHLSNISVQMGQTVKQGEIIGHEGGDPYNDPNPGNSTGHHLHFEMRTQSGQGHDIYPDLEQ